MHKFILAVCVLVFCATTSLASSGDKKDANKEIEANLGKDKASLLSSGRSDQASSSKKKSKSSGGAGFDRVSSAPKRSSGIVAAAAEAAQDALPKEKEKPRHGKGKKKPGKERGAKVSQESPTYVSETEISNIIGQTEDKGKLTNILRSIVQDAELLDFARRLYTLLAQVNPDRQVYQRGREQQMLDALARLLVGDETCAAVAFDGEHLLIATNEDVHEKHESVWSVNMDVMFGTKTSFIVRPQLNISFNKNPSMRIPAEDISWDLFLRSDLDARGKILRTDQVIVSNVDRVVFTIPPERHNIPSLSLDITMPCTLNREIVMPVGTPIPIGTTLPTQFHNIHTHLDPLERRVQTIINHFSFVIHANDPSLDEAVRKKGLQLAERGRENVLKQSLAWEAAKWYRYDYAKDIREYSDSKKRNFKSQVDEFVSQLNRDFLCFKKENQITQTTSFVVKQWWKTVVEKIKLGELHKPDFIQANDKFIKFAYRYFIDLENLEEYFIESFKSNGKLALLLAKESLFKDMELPIILDGDGQKLHAEMRIFLRSLLTHKPLPYIATTKLTCCHCNLIAQLLGIKVNGRHGKIHIWKAEALIKELVKEDDTLLRPIFGKELYDIYSRMKSVRITISLPDNKQCQVTKARAALLIFQLIGCLENGSDGYLEILGAPHKKLFNKENDYPDECQSDCIAGEPMSREKSPIPAVPGWYNDDMVNGLMDLYFDNLGLGRMHAINVNAAAGEIFLQNLRQRENDIRRHEQETGELIHRVVIPVNLGAYDPHVEVAGTHWAGLYILRHPEGGGHPQIWYFDPLGNGIPSDPDLARLLHDLYPTAQLNVNPFRFQYDDYNCGPWIIEIFRSLIDGGPLPGEIFDIKKARLEHAERLGQELTLQPSLLSSGSTKVSTVPSVKRETTLPINIEPPSLNITSSEEELEESARQVMYMMYEQSLKASSPMSI